MKSYGLPKIYKTYTDLMLRIERLIEIINQFNQPTIKLCCKIWVNRHFKGLSRDIDQPVSIKFINLFC